MPTKQSTTKSFENLPMRAKHRYYSELARLTTGLFIGVLALMTFLLTVGISRPGNTFGFFLYSSLIILPLGLLAYVIGQGMHQMLWAKNFDVADKKALKATGKFKAVKGMRAIQVILFVLSLVAITGLTLSTAHFFFAAQAASQAQQQTQSQ